MDYASFPKMDLSQRFLPQLGTPPADKFKKIARDLAATIADVYLDQVALEDSPLNRKLLQFDADIKVFIASRLVSQPASAFPASASIKVGSNELTGRPSFSALSVAGIGELYPHFAKLVDSFLVQFIRPKPTGPSLTTLAVLIKGARLAVRLLNFIPNAPPPASLSELIEAVESPVLLPAAFQLPKNRVQPVGVADLLVIKQHLLRYEAADIGRIENVIRGEIREHSSKHTVTSESEFTTDNERESEIERSITSDDRADFKSEIQNTLKESIDVTGNVKVGYGGDNSSTWHFSASVGVQYQKSSEESSKFASELAKDVTQKAASKVTERMKETRRTKTTELLEDLEKNGFDNKGGQNVSGVYQFINKVYLAQVFNYGKRFLFDFNVPDPAAYFIDVVRQTAKSLDIPVAPPPLKWVEFPGGDSRENRPLTSAAEEEALLQQTPGAKIHELSPGDLRADVVIAGQEKIGVSYLLWIARLGLSNVSASPELRTSVGRSFAREVQKDANSVLIEDSIPLPEGYHAVTAKVTMGWRHGSSDEESALVSVRLANADPIIVYDRNTIAVDPKAVLASHITSEGDIKEDNFSSPVIFRTLISPAEPIVGSLPISVTASKVDHVAVGIEAFCMRLDGWLRKWQLQTYAQIVQHHTGLVNGYKEALAKVGISQKSLSALGRNELTNRDTERLELKRASINIISGKSGQGVLGNGAIAAFTDASVPPSGTIKLDPAVKEPDLQQSYAIGATVRFFEQAFEWDKMGYLFYPYFWGRMDGWAERLRVSDNDPLFEQFLKAGSARVVIPIRLGFEKAVLYYLMWDEPWMGGDLPDIADSTYLPLTEEIRSVTGAPGAETPVDTPWEITVPTQLMKLRTDDSLPQWTWVGHDEALKAAESGNWVWKTSTPTPPPNG